MTYQRNHNENAGGRNFIPTARGVTLFKLILNKNSLYKSIKRLFYRPSSHLKSRLVDYYLAVFRKQLVLTFFQFAYQIGFVFGSAF